MSENVFSKLSDDVVLNIFFKLENDPRNWGRLACVSPKFLSLISNVCCRSRTSQTIPAVVNDLVTGSGSVPPLNYWSSLYKLSVCCPGLLHAGVLLENSDFGLERELGPDENEKEKIHVSTRVPDPNHSQPIASSSGSVDHSSGLNVSGDCSWSLFDDLMYDTVYDPSETPADPPVVDFQSEHDGFRDLTDSPVPKRRRILRSFESHLASGAWTLSREEGNKLLASRFKGDCLYICDWPGCLHMEEKRNYMLFRGIFKDFKQSRVWRTINDGSKSKIDLNCAFCSCKETYDLHSAFCLRRYFGFHDDGEPVVRAYVCENGHVSGAWTDWPLYT